ncbi:hypothetical protein ARMSODRAFT_44461 [Armillaria solidipes]|uniref:Uncharacterized protein n=1 Tax=Armillaria solidipes TaxID=1076256 RepID=A0A2H3CT98_9AGAR|nr:hypothetical protein ARMSODRAFT_44461 [Armillaria solidipes]
MWCGNHRHTGHTETYTVSNAGRPRSMDLSAVRLVSIRATQPFSDLLAHGLCFASSTEGYAPYRVSRLGSQTAALINANTQHLFSVRARAGTYIVWQRARTAAHAIQLDIQSIHQISAWQRSFKELRNVLWTPLRSLCAFLCPLFCSSSRHLPLRQDVRFGPPF